MLYEVGEKYDFAIRNEGVVFDISDSGAILMVFFHHPSKEEIEQFKSEKQLEIKCACFKHTIFILSKIGNLQWMDSPYHPDLSTSLTELKEAEGGEGLSLQIMLFDSSNGELKSLRLIGTSTDFTRKLYREISKLSLDKITYEKYMSYLSEMYKKYSTKDLVRMSSFGFKLRG